MHQLKSPLLVSLAVLNFSLPACCQANVNEGLETASIYVDAAKGSDSNPGTASKPLKTIGAAASLAENNNQKSVGSRVIINPGTYREAVRLTGTRRTTSLPITFEAATNGTVVVSGAEPYTNWQVYGGNSDVYTHSWSYAWGLCPPLPGAPAAPNIVLRREMVFVNGTPLTQVLSLNEVMAGTFYVDEKGGALYVWPPAGTNMSAADVEVSTLPSVWTVLAQGNLVMRGLTFQYANSCHDTGAVEVSGSGHPVSNVLFDSDSFVWNNAHGLRIQPPVTDYTVEHSAANHNGESGFQASKLKGGLFESDQVSYNNWRGAEGAYYTWNSSGAHFYQMHGLTINGLTTSYNQTYGVHFDTDNENVTLGSIAGYENELPSMFFEKSQGPLALSNSTFCSGPEPFSVSNVGLLLRNSAAVTVTGTNFVNSYGALGVTGIAGGTPGSNWETGQTYNLVTQNLTLMQNVLEAGSGQRLFSDSLSGGDWSSFACTLVSNYNTWWDGENPKPFSVPTSASGASDSFSGWQAATGQDKQSISAAAPASSADACSGAPDRVDYWLVVPYDASPITVTPGGATAFSTTLVPLGFTGTVSLSDDGVASIPGAHGNWSASELAPNGSATFTVTTTSSTPAGTYPIVLMATSGSLTHDVTVLLTVE